MSADYSKGRRTWGRDITERRRREHSGGLGEHDSPGNFEKIVCLKTYSLGLERHLKQNESV